MNCYILAGGRSTRMGRSKASIEFAGSTFLARVAAAARGAFDDVIVVVRPGWDERLPEVGLVTIEESAHRNEGAIFGVVRALEHAGGACFILATDYPLITTATLARIRSEFDRRAPMMLVPVRDGILQPLCAAYAEPMRKIVEGCIARGELALHRFADAAERIELDGPELMNVNTPEELREAGRIHEQQALLSSR